MKRIEVSLGDYLILKLNAPLKEYLSTEKVGHKIGQTVGLYIDDLFFKDLPPMAVPGREKAVMFHLVRTDDNRDAWAVLFARKSFSNNNASNLTCDRDPNDGIRLTVGFEDGTQVAPSTAACLEYFPNVWAAVFLLSGALALIILTIVLAIKTSMLRDIGIPPAGQRATWSLARFQMALWFVTVVAGVLFNYAVTGDISPIPQGALILMGIGAGTAVSAFAIDATSNMPGTKADYRVLRTQQAALDAKALALLGQITSVKATSADDPKLPDLKKQFDDVNKDLEPRRRK